MEEMQDAVTFGARRRRIEDKERFSWPKDLLHHHTEKLFMTEGSTVSR